MSRRQLATAAVLATIVLLQNTRSSRSSCLCVTATMPSAAPLFATLVIGIVIGGLAPESMTRWCRANADRDFPGHLQRARLRHALSNRFAVAGNAPCDSLALPTSAIGTMKQGIFRDSGD